MWKKYSELYEVSTEGHIRNSKTGRILREFEGPDGFDTVRSQHRKEGDI